MGNNSEQGNHRGLPLRETAITVKIRCGIDHNVPVGAGPCAYPVPIPTGPGIRPKTTRNTQTRRGQPRGVFQGVASPQRMA